METTSDCVRVRREGAERIMKQLEGNSLQKQIEYWQEGTKELKRHQEKLRETGRSYWFPRDSARIAVSS